MSQLSFIDHEVSQQQKQTRRGKFLAQMEQVVPWRELESVIEPHYPQAGNGRRPFALASMLRIHFMQQWFNLSDPAMEDALYDSHAMSRFAGLDFSRDGVPDETTILHFRHLLERHGLSEQIFAAVNEHLKRHGQFVQRGTIVDATLLAAPSSTKNRDRSRDAAMSSTKKGGQWHFGMKAHVGVDSVTGLAHTMVCGTAEEHDSQRMDELLRGDEKEIYGDKAYCDAGKQAVHQQRGTRWRVTIKAHRNQPLTAQERRWNRSRNAVRAKVEHMFGVVKNLWGHRKVRYRGLFKNQCQMQTVFALANLYLSRDKLLSKAPCRA